MSYYQRPMGDYKTYGYAGDPGFLSSIFKIGKKIYKAFKSPAVQAAGTALMVGGAASQLAGQGPVPQPPQGTIGGALTFPGGTRVSTAWSPGAPGAAAPSGMAPRGYHLDKATGSRWVRNRRMNIANPRALRKAMRRVQGFEKLAKRTISFSRRVKMKR